MGLGGFSHPVKVVVRLVSFPLSGVRNDLAGDEDRSLNTGSSRAIAARRQRDSRQIIPTWLGQLPQRFLQFGQPVDFSYSALQRLHGSSDVLEKMFVTFDQPEKSVST